MTSSSSSSSRLARIGEWLFRRDALRVVRDRLPRSSETAERAVDQARLLVEVARRVAEPVESLPKGSQPAVLSLLYREAVYWALVGERASEGATAPSDLAQAWASTPSDRLARGLPDPEAFVVARSVLVERSPEELLSTTSDEAGPARAFAEALLWDLDAPIRELEKVQVQRWTRVALLVGVLLLAALGLRVALRGPNLVATKVFKTSSALPECTAPNKCADLFFHTQSQDNPWVDFDLGGVKSVERVEVTNRSDCCADRAVPLIVEVSLDDQQWTQVARRDAEFTVWTADFPKRKARYVRFRAPRNTVLHFDDVVVR